MDALPINMDVFDAEKRSAVMARIRSKQNRDTELRMVALLKIHRITGWRRGTQLPGKPDFAFPKARIAMFVDGCFWHGCPEHFRAPKSRQEYWNPKISRNCERDEEVTETLTKKGWRVLRVWEHDLQKKRVDATALRIKKFLDSVTP